jgi:hypothetical protein
VGVHQMTVRLVWAWYSLVFVWVKCHCCIWRFCMSVFYLRSLHSPCQKQPVALLSKESEQQQFTRCISSLTVWLCKQGKVTKSYLSNQLKNKWSSVSIEQPWKYPVDFVWCLLMWHTQKMSKRNSSNKNWMNVLWNVITIVARGSRLAECLQQQSQKCENVENNIWNAFCDLVSCQKSTKNNVHLNYIQEKTWLKRDFYSAIFF